MSVSPPPIASLASSPMRPSLGPRLTIPPPFASATSASSGDDAFVCMEAVISSMAAAMRQNMVQQNLVHQNLVQQMVQAHSTPAVVRGTVRSRSRSPPGGDPADRRDRSRDRRLGERERERVKRESLRLERLAARSDNAKDPPGGSKRR